MRGGPGAVAGGIGYACRSSRVAGGAGRITDRAMVDPALALRCTAPRVPRSALLRPRLQKLWQSARENAVVLIEAPSGFGKTTLLLQWRRAWLEQGALVGWLTLDAEDDPPRLAQALLHCMRAASGRGVFETLATQFATHPGRDLDALTSLLSAIADLATPTVLMFDDAERLPPATAEHSLAYLLLNAPSNLQIVIGSRTALPISTSEMLAKGALTALSARDLRLDRDESIAILTQRFGTGLSLDDRVRLHELTDGWPIGLQLAAATIDREPDLHLAVQALSARSGAIERFFLESLLARLPKELADFLTRISILDVIALEPCEYVTGCERAAAFMDQLSAQTPIFVTAEKRDWIRMHPLARDFLLARFERLPKAEQVRLHRRASEWFAAREQFHEAGRHALAAGDSELALSCAARSLWDLARLGKISEAREWLDRIPPAALEKDVSLSLAAAWIMALCDRAPEGQRIAERLLQSRSLDAKDRFSATLVDACGAIFTDRIGLLPSIMKPYPQPPPSVDDPTDLGAYANTMAAIALFRADHQEVRRIEVNVQGMAEDWSTRMSRGLGKLLVGLSHLQEGNVYRAEAALHQPLISAEQQAGRRSALAGMYASVLAAVAYERDQLDTAEELLADRLDVIERTSIPDTILWAYVTLARLAMARGDERRAMVVLENLRAFAEARLMPRLKAVSLAGEARLHAVCDRPESAAEILRQLEAMRPVIKGADYSLYLPHFELAVALTQAYCALGLFDPAAAERALKRAETHAARLKRGRDQIVIMVLRAVAIDAQGGKGAEALLKEASGLAALNGLARVIADAHPRALQLLHGPARSSPGPAPTPAAVPLPQAQKTAAMQGGLLTPKEAQILGLLNSNLSNKLIARTLDVSGDTVKWHLKNLFSKLNAGSRRHAVDRARLLGLL